jgi:hypothetical protein
MLNLNPLRLRCFALLTCWATQEEAGEMMGVSRGTIWRLIQEARKKTAEALTEGRGIRIMSDNEED